MNSVKRTYAERRYDESLKFHNVKVSVIALAVISSLSISTALAYSNTGSQLRQYYEDKLQLAKKSITETDRIALKEASRSLRDQQVSLSARAQADLDELTSRMIQDFQGRILMVNDAHLRQLQAQTTHIISDKLTQNYENYVQEKSKQISFGLEQALEDEMTEILSTLD